MRTQLICLTLLAVGLGSSPSTPCAAQANGAPFQSRPFTGDGVVTHVDSTHDRLIMNRDDGRPCLLDTADAEIAAAIGGPSAKTQELAPGMRIHVTGRQISSGLVEVTQLRVLGPAQSAPAPARPAPAPPALVRPRGPDVPPGTPVTAASGEDIDLRGTVSTTDLRRGVFVVRVRDHTRTIYLADDTDLSGLALRDPGRFPVKTGDRVTVWGRLQPDGGVLAGAISKATTPPAGIPHPDRILFGQVTSMSNRLTNRDIKLRLADHREVKVKVRRGLVIRRDGREISVHDLRNGNDVRTTGSFDGSDFKADHIDVLHRDDERDTPAPTRGL